MGIPEEVLREVYARWSQGDFRTPAGWSTSVSSTWSTPVHSDLQYFHVWTLRGERPVRLEVIRDEGEARAAAGLRQPAGARGEKRLRTAGRNPPRPCE